MTFLEQVMQGSCEKGKKNEAHYHSIIKIATLFMTESRGFLLKINVGYVFVSID